jgi:hypothetical protein
VTLPLSYSRPRNCSDDWLAASDELKAPESRAPDAPSHHLSLVTSHCLCGGQGRIRTSVDRMGRQIYSLLLLTAQPPVRVSSPKTGSSVRAAACHSTPLRLGLGVSVRRWRGAHRHPRRFVYTKTRIVRFPYSVRTSITAGSTAGLASSGAGEGIRTPDPLITNQMLYQLSYASRRKQLSISFRKDNCKGPNAKFTLLQSQGSRSVAGTQTNRDSKYQGMPISRVSSAFSL